MDCSLPIFSVHGVLQARILEWVAISSSRGSSGSRDRTCISCISCVGRQILSHESLGKPTLSIREIKLTGMGREEIPKMESAQKQLNLTAFQMQKRSSQEGREKPTLRRDFASWSMTACQQQKSTQTTPISSLKCYG